MGYEEGIYVGYRFYETAVATGYFGQIQTGETAADPYYNRQNGVVYPFGYGLSYTTFRQAITGASYADGVFTFEVEVRNTGDAAGKDVVELYLEAPYIQGGIEKSKVVLCGFDKTDLLEPGASQTMTIRVNQEDVASYDDTVNQCYVLDAGDYTFYLGTVDGTVYGSHSWAYATPQDSKSLDQANAVVFAQADAIDRTYIYNEAHDGARSSDEVAATNAFETEMTGNNLKVSNGAATMNRADGFAASYPTAPQAEDTVMPQELKTILDGNNYSTKEATALHDEELEMPATGRKNGLQLIQLRGLSYDDPLWQSYLEQWTPEEMALLLGKAGFQTESFTRHGKPTTLDNDGPQSFRHQALGEENERVDTYYMTAFCCVGNTWSGGNHALLQTVLRDEWGFRGTALTDYALHDFMYPDQMIRNGGTACLQSNRKNFVDQNNPGATTVHYLQKATHEMCYMVANSNAMDGMAPGSRITYSLAPWEMGCAAAVTVTGLLFALVILLSVLRVRDEKRHPERYAGTKHV